MGGVSPESREKARGENGEKKTTDDAYPGLRRE